MTIIRTVPFRHGCDKPA